MLDVFHIIVLILLIWAAWSDVQTRLIPNRIPFCGLVLFLPAMLMGAIPAWPVHLLILCIAFVLCLGLFATNLMGGGDAKLIPVVAMWAGPDHIAIFLLAMALGGGLIALALLVGNRKATNGNSPVSPSCTPSVPYAVAIAIGGAIFTTQPAINAFGAMLTGLTGNGV